MELYDDDFDYMRDGDEVYVSRGEDFDHATYYSEYEIVKTLGFGGFGKVVLGIHKKTGEQVAIKSTKASAIESVDDIMATFQENETLKALKHPGIVTIHNFFMIKKNLQAYFIMEYLEGGELLEYVAQKGRLSEEETRIYFAQIIDALDFCHRNKIIHRDLKLENIMKVTSSCDRVKIVDFGIAGLCAGRQSELTKAGSLNYMPPEIFKNKDVGASPDLDVWALGCMLYAMVIGNLPFVGKTDSELKKQIAEKNVEWPDERETGIKVTPEFKDLVFRILTKNPEKRINMYEIREHPWVKQESVGSMLEKEYEQKMRLQDQNAELNEIAEEDENEKFYTEDNTKGKIYQSSVKKGTKSGINTKAPSNSTKRSTATTGSKNSYSSKPSTLKKK